MEQDARIYGVDPFLIKAIISAEPCLDRHTVKQVGAKTYIELALAAYNAGRGAVEKYQAIPPYKQMQKYVRRVLDYYESYIAMQLQR